MTAPDWAAKARERWPGCRAEMYGGGRELAVQIGASAKTATQTPGGEWRAWRGDVRVFAADPISAIEAAIRAELAERERDEARRWAEAAAADENANAADLRAARATLAAIHDALGSGADESVWPSGLTAAEAVAKTRATLDAVAAYADELMRATWRDSDITSAEAAHGMNMAGIKLADILGGARG